MILKYTVLRKRQCDILLYVTPMTFSGANINWLFLFKIFPRMLTIVVKAHDAKHVVELNSNSTIVSSVSNRANEKHFHCSIIV